MTVYVRPVLIGVISLIVLNVPSHGQNAANPIQVALLRWYQGNTVAQFTGDGTCTSPNGIAFDGAHIWVACNGANKVEELDSSDGRWLASVTGITNAHALLYDGANIWVTDSSATAGTVYKIDVAAVNGGCTSGPTCVTTPISSVTTGPWAMTFDGKNVWVSNYNSSNLYKIPPTGPFVSVPLAGCSAGTTGLTFDTQYIWAACSTTLYQITTGGTVVQTITQPYSAFNLAYDGANAGTTCMAHSGNSTGNIWVASDTADGQVWNVSACSYSVSSTIGVPGSYGIAFDGKYIWVADYNSSQVTKFLASNPSAAGIGGPFSAGTNPSWIAFDGGNVWVTNTGSNSISKF